GPYRRCRLATSRRSRPTPTTSPPRGQQRTDEEPGRAPRARFPVRFALTRCQAGSVEQVRLPEQRRRGSRAGRAGIEVGAGHAQRRDDLILALEQGTGDGRLVATVTEVHVGSQPDERAYSDQLAVICG